MGCSDGMEPEDDKTKKLNDDFVEFMRKRSDTEAPRYTARLKTYVDFKRKRDRATAARRHYEGGHEKTLSATRKKGDEEQKDKGLEINDHTAGDKERISRSSVGSAAGSAAGDTSEGSFRPLQRRGSSASTDAEPDSCVEPFLAARLPPRAALRDGEKLMPRARSFSRSRSGEPSDRCGRRRRRRRSCRRRRRRRRSCRRRRRRRRSCRRRRRRSCRRRRSRRRRRRSCCRRRRRRCRRRR